jgi:hypothetical protein
MVKISLVNLLFENPLPIWALGAVCLAISVIVFFAKRSLGSILGMVGVIAATLLLVFVERSVVTPSEEVEQAVTDLLSAIEANDLPGVLAQIGPTASHVRTDAETLMPQVNMKDTGSTGVRVEVDQSANPARAIAHFRGRIDGTHSRSGARLFFFDQVEIDWQKTGAMWQITDYRVMYRGKPVNPVNSFKGGRGLR